MMASPTRYLSHRSMTTSRRAPGFSSLLLLIIVYISGARCACYLPNGTDVNNLYSPDGDVWTPCSTTGDSMCCRMNVTSGADTCVFNGLCHNDEGPNLWRESCTDPTWTSPSCLQLCVNANRAVANSTNARWPNGTSFEDAHVAITQCENGSFCCNQDNVACCERGNGLFIVDGRVQTTTETATSSAAGSSSTFTSTTTGSGANATSISDSDGRSNNGGSSAGAIAGGVIGGLAGLALLISAVLFFVRRKRSSDKRTGTGKESLPPELDSTARLEMPGQGSQPVKYAKHGPVPPDESVVHVPGMHELASR